MRNKLFLPAVLIFLSLGLIYPQSEMKEVKELGGGFSYLIPSDWVTSRITNMEFQMVMKKNIGFSPNMNFYKETNKFTFEKYFKINIEDMRQNVADFKEISTEAFITDSKIKGKKFICSNNLGGQNLIQVYYFLEGKDKSKIILTGSSLILEKEKYLPIFESIAKSFKTIK